MSRSSFFSRPPAHDRDSSPLLPQHRNSVSLQNLSPRSSQSYDEESRRVSPSPPPSFYHGANVHTSDPVSHTSRDKYAQSLSPSPSRTNESRRKIQFLAPPPPIATSVYLPSAQRRASAQSPSVTSSILRGGSSSPHVRRGGGTDLFRELQRRERAIQQELQLLLDEQSAGLVQGFGGGGNANASSDAGSNTPTSSRIIDGKNRRSGSTGGIVPVRQPKRKTIGLRGARRGLLREIGELIGLKDEETSILEKEIRRREELLSRVEVWETRIESVKGQLNGTALSESKNEREAEDREIQGLQTEERAVDKEISELEDLLQTRRARKRWLGERIAVVTNVREARLSSYRGAMKEVEREIKEFLKYPPTTVSEVMGTEEGLSSLPAGRRTLPMAREWWSKEVFHLQARKGEVETERNALEEGAKLWDSSIAAVVEFENELRRQMAAEDNQGQEILEAQIEKMGAVVETLQHSAKSAEDRGWNLLICAVGAELAAFKEGQSILRKALDVMNGQTDKGKHMDKNEHSNGINELGENTLERQESIDREDSEDDGPNLAELMIDKGA